MATSSSRIHSSSGPSRPSFTLPFKYRRKSWSVDNSDDLPNDITSSPTAPPPLTSDASSSSCSSSPIASSALLSSSNPGSPTDYSHSHIHPYSRDHDQEAWFDTRLSVSYLPFASRVPAVQHKRKQYNGIYTHQPVYATRERTKWMFDHDTAILSDDEHELDLHDSNNDELLYSSPTRRISFTTSAERDRPYVRPAPPSAGTSISPSCSPGPSSTFPISRRSYSDQRRESESYPPSSPGFSTASPGLPPSSPPPPSSPFTMSIASPLSSPTRSPMSPFSLKRSTSPEKSKDQRRDITPPPPRRRGRVSIESLLSPDPMSRVGVNGHGMEKKEQKQISSSPSPNPAPSLATRSSSVSTASAPVQNTDSSEQSAKREVTPNPRRSPTPSSPDLPVISDTPAITSSVPSSALPFAPKPSASLDLSCSVVPSPPLDTPDLTSASSSSSSADPDSPAVEIPAHVQLASPALSSCVPASNSLVSRVSSPAFNAVEKSCDSDIIISSRAVSVSEPSSAETSNIELLKSSLSVSPEQDGDSMAEVTKTVSQPVDNDEDMDIVIDNTPERPQGLSLPPSRHDSPIPSSSTTLMDDISREPSTSKSISTLPISILISSNVDFPRTPIKRRASTSSSFSTRHSSPVLPSSPLSPVSSVFDDIDIDIEEDEKGKEVIPKKRKGKAKVENDGGREKKRVKVEKIVKRRKSSASASMSTSGLSADESEINVKKMQKREVKRTKKRTIVFSDEEDVDDHESGVGAISGGEVEKKPAVKKRGRKPKASTSSTEEPPVASTSTSAVTDDLESEPKPKRKPGRPRKKPLPSSTPDEYSSLLKSSLSPSKHSQLAGLSILDLLPFKPPLPLDELQGMLIETLATSRASSLGPSVVWSTLVGTRPALKEFDVVKREGDAGGCVNVDSETNAKGKMKGDGKENADVAESAEQSVSKEEEGEGEKMGRREWMMLIEAVFEEGKRGCGMFGKVESSFKDDSGRPLEAQWFYVPECDPDTDRATLIRSMMPRPGKRTVTKQYKQYYWRPLGKISRWDDEDAI